MRHIQDVPFVGDKIIERHRLDNGLELLLLVDGTAPVVCVQTWFAVGSRHEREGKTGIAHLFEHLMFNETHHLPYGEFDRRLEELGAETNAATYLDWTYYVENVPREGLALVLEMEADRMQHLVLREPQLESEREVVSNERRQTVDDDVDGTVAELLYQHAFTRHGYRWPTIGSMEDIQNLGIADCLTFYATYYAPNNAKLVVVGDVDRDALLAQVAERYGHIPSAVIPPEPSRPEPEQTEERRLTTQQPVATPRIAMGYKSPAMADPDHIALSLLNEILFGGRGSRMHRSLVQQRELASEVNGYVGAFRDPALWDLALTAHEGVSAEALLAGFDEVIAGVEREPPSAAELERARARLELSTLMGLETMAGKAEQIGFCETVLGDPAAAFRRLEAVARVATGDLAAVAARYLRPERRTIVTVVPEARG